MGSERMWSQNVAAFAQGNPIMVCAVIYSGNDATLCLAEPPRREQECKVLSTCEGKWTTGCKLGGPDEELGDGVLSTPLTCQFRV